MVGHEPCFIVHPFSPLNVCCASRLQITFLEFFECLLGCAEVKCQQVCDAPEDQIRENLQKVADENQQVWSSAAFIQSAKCNFSLNILLRGFLHIQFCCGQMISNLIPDRKCPCTGRRKWTSSHKSRNISSRRFGLLF